MPANVSVSLRCTVAASRKAIAAVVALTAFAAPALAHEGKPLAPHDLAAAWELAPLVVLPIVLSAWLYARGVRALWRRSGRGHGVRRWEAAAFAAGWLSLAVALVSPVHALGTVLFSAHMAQHELLMALAAPLLVLGRPVVAWLWAVPLSWRRAIGAAARTPRARSSWRLVSEPFAAWSLHAAALWAWHAPRFYEAAVASDALHALQHAAFIGTALLFWWSLIHGRRRTLGYGAAVLYLFTTALHTSALGALLVFSDSLWYPSYAATSGTWGLSPLEDQQLAGLIMWVPAGVSYLIAALVLFAGMLRASDERVTRAEAAGSIAPRGVETA